MMSTLDVVREACKVICNKFELVRDIDAGMIEEQKLRSKLDKVNTKINCCLNTLNDALFDAAVNTLYKLVKAEVGFELVLNLTTNELNDLRREYFNMNSTWIEKFMKSTGQETISKSEEARIARKCRDQFKKWLRYCAYKTLGCTSLNKVMEIPKIIDGVFNKGWMNFTIDAEIISVSTTSNPLISNTYICRIYPLEQ